jgi:hypothetical protein
MLMGLSDFFNLVGRGLNSALAHNLQTEYKEGFCERIHYIGAMSVHIHQIIEEF